MIVSIHIAKTAGTTFGGRLLQIEFRDRLLLDYGDWVGFNSSEAIARRRQRAAETTKRRAELITACDVIHGHFVADNISAYSLRPIGWRSFVIPTSSNLDLSIFVEQPTD